MGDIITFLKQIDKALIISKDIFKKHWKWVTLLLFVYVIYWLLSE